MNSVIESSFAVDSMFALDNTLPSPTNLTNPDVIAKMLASQSNAGFHDYATTQKPVTSLPDHSLQTDMRTLSSSPSSLSIYEPAFGGGLDDDSCANLDDIDIKPLTDLSGTSFENDVLLTDHLFGSDAGLGAPVAFPGGPTLAALNLDIGDDNMENSTIDNTNIEKYMLSQENSKLMWSQNAPLLSPTDAFPVTNHTEAAKNDAMSILKASSRPAAPLATHQPQTTSVPTTVWGQNSTITITTAAPINSTTPATTTQIINIAPGGYVADTAVQIQTDQKLKELGSNRLKIDGKHLLKALGTLTSSPMASFNLNTVAVKQEVVSLVPSGTVCVSAESVPVGATVVKKEEPACQVNSDAWQTISLNSIKPEPQHAVIKTEPEDMEMESDDSEGELSDDDDVSGDDEPFQIQMSQFNNSIEDLLMQDDFSANGTKKERRFFWQYNTQSKGPKGKRLCKSMLSEDPYNLSDFADPVFDPELNQSRYKHSGKARKGDGNDIKPSPNRLLQLGTELYTLNKQIGSFPPVNELPTKERGKSRREKNKLASRACRLKKKAQNEANKIMLNGLGQEHVRLKTVILNVKKALRRRVAEMRSGQPAQPGQEKLMTSYNKLFNSHLKHMVAGNTALYVNAVLMKAAGVKGPDDI